MIPLLLPLLLLLLTVATLAGGDVLIAVAVVAVAPTAATALDGAVPFCRTVGNGEAAAAGINIVC